MRRSRSPDGRPSSAARRERTSSEARARSPSRIRSARWSAARTGRCALVHHVEREPGPAQRAAASAVGTVGRHSRRARRRARGRSSPAGRGRQGRARQSRAPPRPLPPARRGRAGARARPASSAASASTDERPRAAATGRVRRPCDGVGIVAGRIEQEAGRAAAGGARARRPRRTGCAGSPRRRRWRAHRRTRRSPRRALIVAGAGHPARWPTSAAPRQAARVPVRNAARRASRLRPAWKLGLAEPPPYLVGLAGRPLAPLHCVEERPDRLLDAEPDPDALGASETPA